MYFRHECIPILFMNGTGILKHLFGELNYIYIQTLPQMFLNTSTELCKHKC